jgi:hypothetical protein
MSSKYEWDELGFNPMKDGYWASASEIKKRIEEKEQGKRRDSLVIFGVVAGGMALLILLTYLLI